MSRPPYRKLIADLLHDSPITRPTVIRDVLESLTAGEDGLALDTLCSWIYEDDLPISLDYHERLSQIAPELGCASIVERLRELIVPPTAENG